MHYFVVIACFLGVAVAAPYDAPVAAVAVDSVSVPRYGFNYAVNDPLTGDRKAQTETRDGGVVRGSYSLSEPDGTLRVVDYSADPVTGFNAVVKRVGPAAHPQVWPVRQVAAVAPAPIAVAPAPIAVAPAPIAVAPAPVAVAPAVVANSYVGLGAGTGSYGLGLGVSGYDLGLGGYGGYGSIGGYGGYGSYGGYGWRH